MITSGFTYLAMLVFIASFTVFADRRYKDSLFFRYVPGVVLIYLAVMLCSKFELWKKTDEVNQYYKIFKNNLLPCMIFIMLLRCDLRRIFKLGPKMLLGFFSATFSICLGFIGTFAFFKSMYQPGAWKPFTALCGSWIGGTGNMVAIQKALGVADSEMGYVIMMDSINYAVWVMLLLAAVPYAGLFNKWVKSDTSKIDEIGRKLGKDQEKLPQNAEFADLFILLGASMFVAAACQNVSGMLPVNDFVSKSTWEVLLVTFAGIICAMTPMGKIPGTSQLSNIMLYTLIALIGSSADFGELTQAHIYVVSGFCILGIHAACMAVLAKIFRLDLFTCGVASLANIGGVASAPILAATYSEALIPVGVLMGLLGYVVGTQAGLIVGKILSVI